MGVKYYFTVQEEGSYHESRYYNTRIEAEHAAKKYLNSRNGRYAFPETLRIKSIQDHTSKSNLKSIIDHDVMGNLTKLNKRKFW